MAATLLAVVFGLYLLLVAFLYLMQERMVFLAGVPGRTLQTTPARIGLEYEDVHFEAGDGVALHGWYVHATDARGVVLFLHGNAGNISHRLDSIAIFTEMALDVFIIDYRGYGRSAGKTTEEGTYRDAQAAWIHLVDDRNIDPARIVVFGRSLGGGIAAWLAAREDAAALIVESSFTSARDMAKRLYPFMPVGWILSLEYPVAEYIGKANCPVLVVHSRNDEIIPFDMGRTLYETAPSPKAFLELAGDHNTGFLADRGRYADAIDRFLGLYLPAGAMPGG